MNMQTSADKVSSIGKVQMESFALYLLVFSGRG